ncbi:MAG: peroxide stress protein YaaA [Methylococcaceae bacterium]
MLTVVSPAKTQDFDTSSILQKYSKSNYLNHSKLLIGQLKEYSVDEIASLMNLSSKLAELNQMRYQAWQLPFTLDNAKPAILAFKGDVYTGLDAESLDEPGFEFAQKHLRILSGLYGVLKPFDLIQPYRLEMGTKIQNDRGKDLYQFWGSILREAVEAEPGLTDGVLINLASNEYFKALEAKKISGRVITPVFKDWKNGQYKMISFYAKKARGLMSRYIIDHRIDRPEEIKNFDSDGYRFSEEKSKGEDWVFIRGPG